MDSSKLDKEASDSESLENWTLVDTDEAYEATLLDEMPATANSDNERDHSNQAQYAKVIVTSTEETVETPAPDTTSLDSIPIADEDTPPEPSLPAADTTHDTDDGVSVITDSEPEELGLTSSHHDDFVETLPPYNTSTPATGLKRRHSQISLDSNDYFDNSDLSGVNNELPEDLGKGKDRKYIHQPNKKVNYLLNGMVILCITAVFGLGVGHFLGLQEECPLAAEWTTPSDLIGPETLALLHKLEEENEILKTQLKQLQYGEDQKIGVGSHHAHHMVPKQIDVKQGWDTIQETQSGQLQWDINQAMADPDHGSESVDVVEVDGQALADNLRKLSDLTASPLRETSPEESAVVVPEITKASVPSEVKSNIVKVSPDVLTLEMGRSRRPLENKEHKSTDDFQFPYNDEDLEAFQTRYARSSQHKQNIPERKKTPDHKTSPKSGTHQKPVPHRKKPEAVNAEDPKLGSTGENAQSENKPNSDSFFSQMETELNGVKDRIVAYASKYIDTNKVENHISSSVKTLSDTLEDMKVKIRSVQETTVEKSSHAFENVKKSMFKMVQEIKHTSDKIMRSKPEGGSKGGFIPTRFMKGFNHLKNGLVKNWCHLKGKIVSSLGGQDDGMVEQCLANKQPPKMRPNQHHNNDFEKRQASAHIYSDKKVKLHPTDSFKPKTSQDYNKYVKKDSYGHDKKYNSTKTSKKYKKYDNKKDNNKYIKKDRDQHGNYQNYHKKEKYPKHQNEHNEKWFKQDTKCPKGEHCNVTDGKWMERHAEGRAQMRHADRESEWMFDRAKARQEWRSEKDGWKARRLGKKSRYGDDVLMRNAYDGPWAHAKNV